MPPRRRATSRLLVGLGVIVAAFVQLPATSASAADGRLCLFCRPPITTTTTAPPPLPSPPTTVLEAPPLDITPIVVPGLDLGAAGRLLELINAERTKVGVPNLTMHEPARVIAAGWSLKMLTAGSISHNDAYFSAATRQALGATMLGENVAFDMRVDDAHDNLMHSAPHRANIVNPSFNAVGIGVATDGSGKYFVTQDFLRTSRVVTAKAPAMPSPPAAPRPAAPRPPVARVPVPRAAPPASTTTTTTAPAALEATAPVVADTESRPKVALDVNAAETRGRTSPLPHAAGVGMLVLVAALSLRPIPVRKRAVSVDQP